MQRHSGFEVLNKQCVAHGKDTEWPFWATLLPGNVGRHLRHMEKREDLFVLPFSEILSLAAAARA